MIELEPILTILSGIFYGKNRSILEWADELFLTDRTLRTHLKKLNPILEHYQLQLTYPILNIEGKEIDVRNFFLAIFYEEDTLPHYIFPPNLINDIITDMSHTKFEHFHLNVSRFRLSYLLFITYQRISNGYKIEMSREIKNILATSRLNSTMIQISISFKKFTSIQLKNSDLVYLILMILDSNSYDNNFNLGPIYQEDMKSKWLPVINDFCNEIGISNDPQSIAYIESFFHLNYLKFTVSNSCLFLPPSLLHYYQINYKGELKKMLIFLNKYPNTFMVDTATKFEYTLLLFSMRLMYELKQKNYNIAFLFEGSIESTILLEDLARTYTPSNHRTYFFHAHDLFLENLNRFSIHLVVTNFSEYIFELPEEIDYLLFNYNATAEDWNKFIKYIDPRLNKKYKITFNTDNEV
ncbi:helix-turn-helix domain-containing protein [Carnobacterium maltaromaticum]|uniref:helix-turn-helix domain-containing protein n=1 Tax=Carnobacterium maltaromaticum TaxID=2751 RepID=UPI0039AED144